MCKAHYCKLSIIKRTARLPFCGVTLQVNIQTFYVTCAEPEQTQQEKPCRCSGVQTMLTNPNGGFHLSGEM